MSSPKYILAIDQGTTSTRCCLFNRETTIAASSQNEFPQYTNSDGWVEHDADEIWESVKLSLKQVLEIASVNSGDIAAIGIANQRETGIIWSRKTGKPFRKAIVWQDTRTAQWCNDLAEQHGGRNCFRETTGLPLVPYFSASKIRWMIDNDSCIRHAVANGDAMFGTVDSWLLYNLTGGVQGGAHATDCSNAARTMLFNINTLVWDERLCFIFGVAQSILPAVKTSNDHFGNVSNEQLPAAIQGVPICGMLGDQSAALLGHAGFMQGDTKSTYGTGCFIVQNVGEKRVNSASGLLSILAYQFKGEKPIYGLEGSVAVAGSAVTWLQDVMGIVGSASDFEQLANSVSDCGGVTFVPAFTGLFAPHWRADARGTICGLTRGTKSGHIARAALEATALQCRELVHAMAAESNTALFDLELHVDGGMSVNNLLMQWQADLAEVSIHRSGITETTAAGAALAAGLERDFGGVLVQ
jgi:glycerol kinase